MKIEITRTTNEFVEIEIPFYVKGICHYYKVFSKEKCIQICNKEGHESIEICHSSLAFFLKTNKKCTEKEFVKELDRITKLIHNQ